MLADDPSLAALLGKLAPQHVPSPGRQPVQVIYGGAHLFKSELVGKLGALAQKACAELVPDPGALARVLAIPEAHADAVATRLADKLQREPVEDLRIDFEDGYGHRLDEEEDADATRVARALAEARLLPPFIGIRVKAFTHESHRRAIRTLELFLTTLGKLPPNFVVTLPKVSQPAEVSALAATLALLEKRLGLPPIPVELMIETPRALVAADGKVALEALVRGGRVRGVHLGSYDLTASLGITASEQRFTHPACDAAKWLMQFALAPTGIFLSDGATNVLPLGGDVQQRRAALKLHYDHVRHSLSQGFYQGWDLHPAQLVSRYAAVFAFFREGLIDATIRLSSFVAAASQASRVGGTFDDAATGQGLLNFFLRGLACGALEPDELRPTGVTLDELESRSFAHIVAARR